MDDRSKTVSFRLPPEFLNQLIKDAKSRMLDSHHELARQVVINYLTDAMLEEQRLEFEKLKQSVERLREDFATAAGFMLVSAANWPIDKARAWAKETFFGERA